MPHVAGREDARDARLQQEGVARPGPAGGPAGPQHVRPGQDVAGLVARHDPGEPLRARRGADEREERRGRQRLGRPPQVVEALRDSWNTAAGASATATYACVSTWLTDFRGDPTRIDVPTLVMHGDDDRILPITATAPRTHEAVKGSKLVVVEGAPHGMLWTHAEEVSPALVDFLSQRARTLGA